MVGRPFSVVDRLVRLTYIAVHLGTAERATEQSARESHFMRGVRITWMTMQ